jgi:hypothetical protein
LANQYRELYETHRPTFRNWWPLFYWLIDMACINAYRLYQLYNTSQRPLTHLQFRTELYCRLLGYSIRAKLYSLQAELGGKRVFSPTFHNIHYWEKRPKSSCVWCSYVLRCQKVLGKAVDTRARTKRSHGGCGFCNVNLCKEGDC